MTVMRVDFLKTVNSARQHTAEVGGLERREDGVKKSTTTTTTAHDEAARGTEAQRCDLLHSPTIRHASDDSSRVCLSLRANGVLGHGGD
jgi:hypothetical protein